MKRLAPMLVLLGLVYLTGCGREEATEDDVAPPVAVPASIGNALFVVPVADDLPPAQGHTIDPIVLHDCRLAVIDRQDVPSQREGVLLVIGTDVGPGEEVPADRLVTIEVDGETKHYRRLKEGDRVQAGQVLARLDDRLARKDAEMKACKLAASKCDLEAIEKTRDEAQMKLQRTFKASTAVTAEEVGAARLMVERFKAEAGSKQEGVKLADFESRQAAIVVDQHRIRAAISGKIKTIYKRRGEAVRQLEPVFQIHDLSKLRIEGVAAVEHLDRLRQADELRVIVEPSHSSSPERTLVGHLQEVNAVAVSGDSKLILSASEDGSLRIWERGNRHEQRILWHDSPVRALACTPQGARRSLCVTGSSDGKVRLWNLDAQGDKPELVCAQQHKGSVTALAFSPEGNWFASAGEDREIHLFDAATGELKYRLPAGHRAAITSIQFTPQARLVSTGRDHTLRVWQLGEEAAKLSDTIDRRSGYVQQPGVSPDGRTVLLDQGKVLRLLTLDERRTEGILANPAEGSHFTTFAAFSPDGRLILTAGSAEGRLQLWRAPSPASRPYVLRQFVSNDVSPATSVAFAPDGSFAVTGTKDRHVQVWPLPTAQEIEEQVTARVSLIEGSVESSARQIRFWAEVDNTDGKLVPGTSVTLAIYPR
ncbi:MAG: HlyD family efflux transporter periplasmic adaptor subunit [Gemmataceae bacterium]